MKNILKSKFALEEPAEELDKFISNLKLSDEKKADLLISLLGIFHDNIRSWTTRCYQAVTWAVGINLVAVSYVILNLEKMNAQIRILIFFGLIVFGLLIQLYLRRASRAHCGNRLGISKCEAALGLYKLGEFFKERYFFVYSKEMLRSKNLEYLMIFQLMLSLLSACVVLFGGFLK